MPLFRSLNGTTRTTFVHSEDLFSTKNSSQKTIFLDQEHMVQSPVLFPLQALRMENRNWRFYRQYDEPIFVNIIQLLAEPFIYDF